MKTWLVEAKDTEGRLSAAEFDSRDKAVAAMYHTWSSPRITRGIVEILVRDPQGEVRSRLFVGSSPKKAKVRR